MQPIDDKVLPVLPPGDGGNHIGEVRTTWFSYANPIRSTSVEGVHVTFLLAVEQGIVDMPHAEDRFVEGAS